MIRIRRRRKFSLVGRNPGITIAEADAGSHQEFLDAMFNCAGPGRCYELIRNSRDWQARRASTRPNLDLLHDHLKREGVTNVLETNVICYATPMSKDLRRDEHKGGTSKGREIFSVVLDVIRPKALVVFGKGATKDLGKALSAPGRKVKLLPPVHDPEFKLRPESAKTAWGEVNVLAIPSLAPPAWNKWSRQADAAFPVIARTVAEILRKAE